MAASIELKTFNFFKFLVMNRTYYSYPPARVFRGRSEKGLKLPACDLRFVYNDLEPINTHRVILAANSTVFFEFFSKMKNYRVDNLFPFYRYYPPSKSTRELIVIDTSKDSFRKKFGLRIFAEADFLSLSFICKLMLSEQVESPVQENMFNAYYVSKKFGFELFEDVTCDLMLNSSNSVLIPYFLHYDIPESAGIYLKYNSSKIDGRQLKRVNDISNFYVLMSVLLNDSVCDYKKCIRSIDYLFLNHPEEIKEQLIHHKECTEAAFVVANAVFKHIKDGDSKVDDKDKYIYFVDYQLDWVFSDMKFGCLKVLVRKRKELINKVSQTIKSDLSSWACFALFDSIMYCDRDVDGKISDCYKYMRNLGAVSSSREGVYPKIDLFKYGFISINDGKLTEHIGYAQETNKLDDFFISRFYVCDDTHSPKRMSGSTRSPRKRSDMDGSKDEKGFEIPFEFKDWKFIGSINFEGKTNATEIKVDTQGDKDTPLSGFKVKTKPVPCFHLSHTFVLEGRFA